MEKHFDQSQDLACTYYWYHVGAVQGSNIIPLPESSSTDVTLMRLLSGVDEGVDRASVRSSEGGTTNIAAVRSGNRREVDVTLP